MNQHQPEHHNPPQAERALDDEQMAARAADQRHDEANRVAILADNVTRFVDDHLSGVQREAGERPKFYLRDKQIPVFTDFVDFIDRNSDVPEGESVKCSILTPTGSGKTVMMAQLLEAVSYSPDPAKQPKSLILVPNIALIDQTVGRDAEGTPVGGFAKFAPDVKTSRYFGDEKDLSGDAVIMTYQSLLHAVDKPGELPHFDAVFLDEQHRSSGKKTSEAVAKVTTGNLSVGFTATPRQVHGEVIHEINLREAIDTGMLAPTQVWHYKTNVELNVSGGSGEFKEGELKALIDHEARNAAAIDLTKNYVEQGLSGIVACVPGNDCEHAKDMAQKLSEVTITDPKTGEERQLRSKAVFGSMTAEERQEIYAQYRNGEIDVLTNVDLLTEGWDAPIAKFIINLRPTRSPVNAVQRIGRVLRLEETGTVAQIVEFLDDLKGADQYTALHALGEEAAPMNDGTIYGSFSDNPDDMNQDDQEGRFVPDMDKVRALIESCELETIDYLYVGAEEREILEAVKAGELILVGEIAAQLEELGGQASLNSVGFTLDSMKIKPVNVGGRKYYPKDAIEAVKERYLTSDNEVTIDQAETEIDHLLTGRGVKDVYVDRGIIVQLADNFDVGVREVKPKGNKSTVDVYDKHELLEVIDAILQPELKEDFATVYDFFHSLPGDSEERVRYNADIFGRFFGVSKRKVMSNLRRQLARSRPAGEIVGLAPIERRSADVPSLEFVFSTELLNEVSGDARDTYQTMVKAAVARGGARRFNSGTPRRNRF
jgi:superfamily II DNA or RNA helicase